MRLSKTDILVGGGLLVILGAFLWLLLDFHLNILGETEWETVPVQAKAAAGIWSAILSFGLVPFPLWVMIKRQEAKDENKTRG